MVQWITVRTEHDARQSLNRLLDFLGGSKFTRKFAALRLEAQSSQGLYLEKWVKPKNLWWTQLEKAIAFDEKGRRFTHRLNEVHWPFETGKKISEFYTDMSPSKRNELRGRILGNDDIRPVLLEIDMAAHFLQMGFHVDWLESTAEGERTADFVCKKKDFTYEVECKSKTVDAGRMVERPHFYRLVDLLSSRLSSIGLHGNVHVLTPGRLPKSKEWQKELVEKVADLGGGAGGQQCDTLADGTSVKTSLTSQKESVPKQEIDKEVASRKERPGQIELLFKESQNAYEDPLVIHVESQKRDDFQKSVLRDLKDATSQLSGSRTGIIFCSVPEVENIDQVPSDSIFHELSDRFFKSAPDSVWGVTFVSDPVIVSGQMVRVIFPAKTFFNSRYDTKWGSAEEYMARP